MRSSNDSKAMSNIYILTPEQHAALVEVNAAGMLEALTRVTDAHLAKNHPFHNPVDADARLALRELKGLVSALTMLRSMKPVSPIAEITCEDMGRPFNAMQIRTHFYKEVPPVGTKIYAAKEPT